MSAYIRPPLKWAGGKFRLLDRILPELPEGKRLVEPFMGSGAVFLNADYPAFLLCDTNKDLILFFQTLVRQGDVFIRACRKYFQGKYNTRDAFEILRTRFNSLNYGKERAALFLYLNRHGYNGLVRYNAKGKFNTPFGKYAAPYFPEKELQAVLEKASRAEVEFRLTDFRETFASLKAGDVVYCDPPYVTLSATANFTAYTPESFSPDDQETLARYAVKACEQGNPVVLSNHDTKFSKEMYKRARLVSFPVQRLISRDGSNRFKVQELLAVFL